MLAETIQAKGPRRLIYPAFNAEPEPSSTMTTDNKALARFQTQEGWEREMAIMRKLSYEIPL